MPRAFTLLLLAAAAVQAASTLDLYFIDVEGGQATLIVAPSGQSLLVDAGWPGFDGRDAERIVAAARQAGLKRIDYLLVTHYHTDHVGGVPQLVQRLPVGTFVDHGPSTETGSQAGALTQAYLQAVSKGKHLVVKPGDSIPLKGLEVRVLCAGGQHLSAPLPSAGVLNPLCRSEQQKEDDPSENGRSVGFLLSFGRFRFLDLGDLTTHHGLDMSGPTALVHALRPRVAVMNNGARKGGSPSAWRIIKASPGLEDMWQLHTSLAGDKEANAGEQYVANLEERCQGHWIKVSARPDGWFEVFNSRTGFRKQYRVR